MPYVDGFVVAVPEKNLAEYKKMARKAGKIWKEHGALSYIECVGDDVPVGKVTSFTKAVNLKRGETVVFSWITYKSKRDRDAVNKKVLADPRVADGHEERALRRLAHDLRRLQAGDRAVDA